MKELRWIGYARTLEGVSEIKGPKTNASILAWLKRLKSYWADDETPWCGTFVAHVLQDAGLEYPKEWARARAYLGLPLAIPQPAYGCIVVFERDGGGHVGFVVGKDQNDNLMVLGGNQGDKVSIKPFPRSRALGYRWPSLAPDPSRYNLPLLKSDGTLSKNEA